MITIISLSKQPSHSLIVARMALESDLQFDTDAEGEDYRLSAWQRGDGQWAAASVDGLLAGIAFIDQRTDGTLGLVWLETRAPYKGAGVGTALLRWAQEQAKAQGRQLVINSVAGATSFYAKALPGASQQGHVFTVAA